MANDDTATELAKLRAELAALKQTRSDPPPPVDIPATAPAGKADIESGNNAEEEPAEELKSQLDELLDLLKGEIGELPTITCVLVFSLGILMGRLMR